MMVQWLQSVPARRWLLAVTCASILTPARGTAQDSVPTGVRIGLTYRRDVKPSVAITPVAGPYADTVRAMLARDLDFSDRLTVMASDSGPAPQGALNYELYAALNAVAVVQAAVTPAGALHVAVHDVAAKRVASVMDLPFDAEPLSRDWRRIVHVVADSIEWVVLGQRGISSTRIAFVRNNQIWEVDADGEGLRAVPGTADGGSPAWDAKGRRLAYHVLRNEGGPHRIVVRDMVTGATWTTRAADLSITPVFSPDGSKIMFAAGSDGMELYEAVPFDNDRPRRITSRRGSLNVSPTFSPDGRRVAFTSNILGHPEVYIMDADGSSAELLTSSGFGEDLFRSNASWSPDGRLVAFQSRIKGVEQVMTIAVRDRSTRQLTSEGKNEDPSWAPDGRHLVFVSTRTGSPQLWVMDAESSRARQLTRGGRVQNPAWSPRLDFIREP